MSKEGWMERRIDEDGNEWLDMFTYNEEVGEVELVDSIPAHWMTHPDEY